MYLSPSKSVDYWVAYLSIPSCQHHKVVSILSSLKKAVPYPLLGGVKIKRRPYLIRFKLGRGYRLVVKQTVDGFEPYKVMTRQCFQRELTRRS